ncbi:ring-hydroxylating dioxygenase ferredoxin reductase family protein [Sphingobium sp. SJ10-10]|uniref:ring-hydroxylating dioxygenase ferredoxin reductase family protein n=1 Tax=Sphingobium sp. SJ10-10 TaxID=3114999 RepID=UPI002E19D0EA|nr:ring-hydroxylating dioxygenase ferredoxin reductase family protein [Sphingobium sp. SJ10-10]
MADAADVLFAFADGVERSVSVTAGDTILDAGLAAELPLLYQCRSGSCSSCIAKLVEGETRQAAGHTTLLRSEYEAGMRLLCQTHAVGACRFEMGYDSEAGTVRATKANAFVDEVERIASNVVRLRLELAADNWVDFRPGQFFQISVPGIGAVRSYSPASTPKDLPRLEFLIRLLPGGVMSEWLTDRAKPDDVVEIEGAFGAFFLREKVRAPHILVAGGTGLAPMLSILDALREQSGRRPRMLLSFGCTDPDALFGLDAIMLREQWMPTFRSRISVDRGATGDLLGGTPVDALLPEDVSDPDTVAYLCGPPRMIEAAHARLEALGVKPENIFAEQFVPSETTGVTP